LRGREREREQQQIVKLRLPVTVLLLKKKDASFGQKNAAARSYTFVSTEENHC
jgi:hypothetical protein